MAPLELYGEARYRGVNLPSSYLLGRAPRPHGLAGTEYFFNRASRQSLSVPCLAHVRTSARGGESARIREYPPKLPPAIPFRARKTPRSSHNGCAASW